MRKLLIATLAGSLLIPTVVLAQTGALAPGKPAGVQKAQLDTTGVIVGLGALAVAVTVGVIATDCCKHSNTPVVIPTTTTG
jgi:hypothetical protein